MKYFKLVALCLLPLCSHAQDVKKSTKEIICAEMKWLVNTLTHDYGEIPVFGGVDADAKSNYVLTVNPKTGSWTMVQFNSGTGCVVGTGDGTKVDLKNLQQIGKPV